MRHYFATQLLYGALSHLLKPGLILAPDCGEDLVRSGNRLRLLPLVVGEDARVVKDEGVFLGDDGAEVACVLCV